MSQEDTSRLVDHISQFRFKIPFFLRPSLPQPSRPQLKIKYRILANSDAYY